jgi:hypothetical protein
MAKPGNRGENRRVIRFVTAKLKPATQRLRNRIRRIGARRIASNEMIHAVIGMSTCVPIPYIRLRSTDGLRVVPNQPARCPLSSRHDSVFAKRIAHNFLIWWFLSLPPLDGLMRASVEAERRNTTGMDCMGREKPIRRQSLMGLNAINFFQAEMVGVTLPALGAFLREVGWRYDSIGVATALAGLALCSCRQSQERLQIAFPPAAVCLRSRQSSPGSAPLRYLSFRQVRGNCALGSDSARS